MDPGPRDEDPGDAGPAPVDTAQAHPDEHNCLAEQVEENDAATEQNEEERQDVSTSTVGSEDDKGEGSQSSPDEGAIDTPDQPLTNLDRYISELKGFEMSTQDILRHLSEEHGSTVALVENFGQEGGDPPDSAAMNKLQLNLLVIDHKIMLETQKAHRTSEKLKELSSSDCDVDPDSIFDINDFLVELESDSEIKHLESCVNDYETQLMNSYDDAATIGAGDGSYESKVIETIGTSVPNAMIDAVVRNTKGLINSNITCFVNRFLFAAERPSEINHYCKRHNKQCRTKHLPVYLETEPDDVRLFIDIMTDLVYDFCKDDYTCTVEEIEATLENYIFPQIYQQCMKHVSKREEDQLISDKCREFSYVTQSQIFISQAYQSPEVVPFIMPISKLRTMFFQLTPSKKLYTMFSAAQSVVATIDAHHKGLVLGGDDFLPIWIYVVLHANAHEMASTIEFIRAFANPALMQTELGYYFSSLELAVEFIKALIPEKLNNTSPFLEHPFLVYERERCRRWANGDRHIDMVEDHVTLKGYKMFVVEEWIGDRTKFSHVIITASDNEDDEIHAAIMKANDKTTSSQQHFLESVFYRPPAGQRMHAVETDKGIALVCDLHIDSHGRICNESDCPTEGDLPAQGTSQSSASAAQRLSEAMADSPALEERFRTVSNMSQLSGGHRSRSNSDFNPPPPAPSFRVGRHTDADLDRPLAAGVDITITSADDVNDPEGAMSTPPATKPRQDRRSPIPDRVMSTARVSVSQPSETHPLDGSLGANSSDAIPIPSAPAIVATPQRNVLSIDSPMTPAHANDDRQDGLAPPSNKKSRKSTFSSGLPPVLSLEEFAISTQGHEHMAPVEHLDFGTANTDGFRVGSLEAGFCLPVSTDGYSKEEISKLTFLPIPNGDYDQYAKSIQIQLQLRRVGCWQEGKHLSVEHPVQAEEQFRRMYSFYISVDSVTLEAALKQLVVEVQTSLAHLDYGKDPEADGVFSTALVESLGNWQEAYNVQQEAAFADPTNLEPLPEDGHLNPITLTALRRTVANLRELLQHEGFRSKDPIRHPQQFRATVRSFQEQHGIAVSGRLDAETRGMLCDAAENEAISTVGSTMTGIVGHLSEDEDSDLP